MPTDTEPKQDGHTRTAMGDPQKTQDALSGAAAAPQLGQLKAVIPDFMEFPIQDLANSQSVGLHHFINNRINQIGLVRGD
jgi:hypothetical protein